MTRVEADEVALVLRFGRLVGNGSVATIHQPGLLLAMPKPFDKVIRVAKERIDTLEIEDFSPGASEPDARPGYLLLGDRNLVQATLVARYQISDPVARSLRTAETEALVRSSILEATVRCAGAARLEDLLGDGRASFLRRTSLEVQRCLDHRGSGTALVSLELKHLAPPTEVREDFEAVQSAYIAALTAAEEASGYAARLLRSSEAEARRLIIDADAEAAGTVATARGHAAAFEALLPAYEAEPELVLERLYREGIERALGGDVRVTLIPRPPTGGAGAQHVLLPVGGAKPLGDIGLLPDAGPAPDSADPNPGPSSPSLTGGRDG